MTLPLRMTPRPPRPTHFICIPLITPVSRPSFESSINDFRAALQDIKVPAKHRYSQSQGKGAQSGNGKPLGHSLGAREHGYGAVSATVDGGSSSNYPSLVPDEAVKPVGSLHLTIGVLNLRTATELNRAKDVVSNLDINSLLPGLEPLIVSYFSLAALPAHYRGKPQRNRSYVVHLDPHDPSGRLWRFCTDVLDVFRRAGLARTPDPNRPHPRDQVTLHGTLINLRTQRPTRDPRSVHPHFNEPSPSSSSYRNDGSQSRKGDDVRPIDTRSLLERFSTWKWAENVLLDRVALCEMGCEYQWDERGDFVDGQYKEVSSALLPTRNLPSETSGA